MNYRIESRCIVLYISKLYSLTYKLSCLRYIFSFSFVLFQPIVMVE